MALPMPPNTTCDIYRSGVSPPAAPSVAGVKCYLHPYGQSTLTTNNYTHKLWVPQGTDIRDGNAIGQLTAGNLYDTIYVPDKNGVAYKVVLVRRIGRGTALDCLLVLVQRQIVTWPSQNL